MLGCVLSAIFLCPKVCNPCWRFSIRLKCGFAATPHPALWLRPLLVPQASPVGHSRLAPITPLRPPWTLVMHRVPARHAHTRCAASLQQTKLASQHAQVSRTVCVRCLGPQRHAHMWMPPLAFTITTCFLPLLHRPAVATQWAIDCADGRSAKLNGNKVPVLIADSPSATINPFKPTRVEEVTE
jgi:hypothetical protein